MLRWARSPESRRMPTGSCPLRRSSSKTRMAFGTPLSSVSTVSTSKQAIVRIDVGVGAKGAQFAHAQRHEELHHAVGVGALWLEAHVCGETYIRRIACAADQGGACARVGAAFLRAAQTELEHRPTKAVVGHPRCLGRDERRIVEVVEQTRSPGSAPWRADPDHGQRFVRMDARGPRGWHAG